VVGGSVFMVIKLSQFVFISISSGLVTACFDFLGVLSGDGDLLEVCFGVSCYQYVEEAAGG